MKKILASGLIALVTMTSVGGAVAQQIVRIASSGDYPPFEITQPDGTLGGFTIDIANAVCADRGLQCEWVKQDFDGLIPGLLSNKFDIISGLTISEERKTRVLFSDRFYRSPVRFFGKEGIEIDPSSVEGFGNYKVGVETGSVMQCYLDKALPDLDTTVYRSQDDAYMDLLNGRIDLLINLAIQTQLNFLDKNPGYAFVSDDLDGQGCFGEGTGAAFRQSDTDLANTFSEGIKSIREKGVYADINAKYFSFDVYGE